MLTLGEMKVADNAYSFAAPTGPQTNGTFDATPDGIAWHGDIGAQVVASNLDGSPHAFWFMFKTRPESLPTTTNCLKV